MGTIVARAGGRDIVAVIEKMCCSATPVNMSYIRCWDDDVHEAKNWGVGQKVKSNSFENLIMFTFVVRGGWGSWRPWQSHLRFFQLKLCG